MIVRARDAIRHGRIRAGWHADLGDGRDVPDRRAFWRDRQPWMSWLAIVADLAVCAVLTAAAIAALMMRASSR